MTEWLMNRISHPSLDVEKKEGKNSLWTETMCTKSYRGKGKKIAVAVCNEIWTDSIAATASAVAQF